MKTRIVQQLKYLLYGAVNILLAKNKIIIPKTLLIIRTDAIGDYILFRNFLKSIVNSNAYQDYRITLVGNKAWQTIAEELDSDVVYQFIWLERNKFSKNLLYRFNKLNCITAQGYDTVLNPMYSKEFFFSDMIINSVTASKKICVDCDDANIFPWQKTISERYYSSIIPSDHTITFEFIRNKNIIETFIGEKLSITQPQVDLGSRDLAFELPKRYAVIFIGANASYRKWSISKYAKLANSLSTNFNFHIVLCGGPNDRAEADEFTRLFNGEFLNLVGRTTLIEMLHVLKQAQILVSNETSAPHMAVALHTKLIFVVSNGNHFGRFTPYPTEVSANYIVTYPHEIESELANFNSLSTQYGFGSSLDINTIDYTTVYTKIDKVIRGQTKGVAE